MKNLILSILALLLLFGWVGTLWGPKSKPSCYVDKINLTKKGPDTSKAFEL